MKSLINSYTKDLTGKVFNRLKVISFAGYFPHSPNSKKKEARWFAECSCDKSILVSGDSLTSGNTKSCGCLSIERASIRGEEHHNYKYGCIENNKLYRLWSHMKERCGNSPSILKKRMSKFYTKKGITVCDEWINDFSAFKKWAEENGYSDKLQIDRIDNNKGYSPSNCRFVTPKENCRNKSNNNLITYDGKTMCLTEWAEFLNIRVDTLYHRLKLGMRLDKALTPGSLKKKLI